MKHVFQGFVFFVSVLAAPTVQGEVPIGVILPLSGDTASVGAAIKNGFELGLNSLPPDVRRELQIHYEDDAGSAAKTVSAYTKLVSAQHIVAAVCAMSTNCKAVAPLAEKNGTPLLAIATDPAVVAGRAWVVNFWTTAEVEAARLGDEVRHRGYKTVARITAIHDFPLAMKKRFDQQTNGSVNVVYDEEYPLEVKDFKTYLAKIAATPGIDAIYVLLMPGQCGTFARQAREHGVMLPLFGAEIFEDSAEVKASNGALIGQWYVNAANPEQRFFEEYRRSYPQSSLYGAPHGHDIALLLGAAVAKGEKAGQINSFLHTVKDFPGVLGPFSASGDNRYTLKAAIKIVTPDGFEQLD